jgi:hypothetical protein
MLSTPQTAIDLHIAPPLKHFAAERAHPRSVVHLIIPKLIFSPLLIGGILVKLRFFPVLKP